MGVCALELSRRKKNTIIHTLIESRANPIIMMACQGNFRHLKSCKVGQRELDKFSPPIVSIPSQFREGQVINSLFM